MMPSKPAVQLIEQAERQSYLLVERVTPSRFDVAKVLRLKFDDKPDISFTDLTSMVVMAELGITKIVTADAHFTHVGMGFQCVP